MESYAKLWLGYTGKKKNRDCEYLKRIVFNGTYMPDRISENAKKELVRGIKGMLDIEPEILENACGTANGVSCKPGRGSQDSNGIKKEISGKTILDNEEYSISIREKSINISACGSVGILYGVFDLLRTVACEKDVAVEYAEEKKIRPSNPLRMLNHWDNMDGSIERGYSGNSFFYENNEIVINERTVDYARLIASVGINAVVINNVNVKQAAS